MKLAPFKIVVGTLSVIVLAGLVLLWNYIPSIYAPTPPSGSPIVDATLESARSSAISSARTSIATLFTGFAAFLTALIGLRTSDVAINALSESSRAARVTERDRERGLELRVRQSQTDEHDARERRVTDQFARSADMLGSTSAATRLSGIYALERLAQANKDQRFPVAEVLCSYLRMPRGDISRASSTDDLDRIAQDDQVRNGAIQVLRRHRRYSEMESATYRDNELFWDIEELSFYGANLVGARLGGADWSHCNFMAAKLQATQLQDSTFYGSDFRDAELQDCWVFNTSLDHCDMRGAEFDRASIVESTLANAYLWGAQFVDTKISHCNAHGARIEGTNLSGVYGSQDWSHAVSDESTVFPDPSASGQNSDRTTSRNDFRYEVGFTGYLQRPV